MESRNLTALELRRLTGTSDLAAQPAILEAAGIPFRPRGWAMGVNAFTNEVQPILGEKVWELIRQENIV